MLLAIAIVALVGSVIGLLAKFGEDYTGNDFVHVVAVMAWWNINTTFAIVWICVSAVLLFLAWLANNN